MVSENQVLGRCRLVRKLGEGGMGVVWLARHETLQKDVAVKVLPPGYAHEADAVQRFLREARAAARLEHPNVIQVLDAGSEGGTHFIVMQYVDGTDLQKILKKKGKLDVADSLAVAKRVALALAAAHKMGIVHRDIKPANILLTKQGRIMVADFGLAREVMGTPQYLSPEQARGEKVDGRSDLYSLGGMLYTLLTGKPPFTGSSPVSIAVKHASADQKPEPIRKIVSDIPADVEALVEKLMAKKADDRFPTGDAVAAAIDALKNGPGTMMTVSQDKVLTPQRKRKLIFAGAGVGLGCLVLFILVLALFGPGRAEKAFRAAGQMRTEAEKLERYGLVVQHFPGTEWDEKAKAEIAALLDANINKIKTAALEGKIPFRDVMARLDALRPLYPGAAATINKVETDLHRSRVIARTRDFGEALKTHKAGDKGERFKEFVSPDAFKKVGEGFVMAFIGLALGGMTGLGARVEDFEIDQGRVSVVSRKEGAVPLRAVIHNRKTNERATHKFIAHWIWQEGDWYLAEKGIVEDK